MAVCPVCEQKTPVAVRPGWMALTPSGKRSLVPEREVGLHGQESAEGRWGQG